jgi:acetylornithine deacetylase/succinyl-diaminopimelate desuccinylase-like protein
MSSPGLDRATLPYAPEAPRAAPGGATGAPEAVHALIDERAELYLGWLRAVIRQPSVSSQGRGVAECARLLTRLMAEAGLAGEVAATGGLPAVLGRSPADLADPRAPTLLIYNHYDVQPEDPVGEWLHPPFAAELVPGPGAARIVGRGATDAKGNLICHLAAADAWRAATGRLPVHLRLLFDGEEESGSPSLPAFVERRREDLRCDFALSFDGGFDASNRPSITLGSSGLLFVELVCEGARHDLHSARARLVKSPAWRLIWALASLKGPDERIAIPGFYDAVEPPDARERELLERAGWDDAAQQRALGVDGFLLGVSGVAALERLLFQPTCNVAGIAAGFAGEGTQTVLPRRAVAKLDFRLVYRQDPDDILAKLRRHLDAEGFHDVRIVRAEGIEPSRAPVDSPVVRAVVEAARETYGVEPVVRPRSDASGRQGCWLGERLGVAGVSTGVGPPDWRGHAANEFMTVSHFLQGIHYAANIWGRLAASA